MAATEKGGSDTKRWMLEARLRDVQHMSKVRMKNTTVVVHNTQLRLVLAKKHILA